MCEVVRARICRYAAYVCGRCRTAMQWLLINALFRTLYSHVVLLQTRIFSNCSNSLLAVRCYQTRNHVLHNQNADEYSAMLQYRRSCWLDLPP